MATSILPLLPLEATFTQGLRKGWNKRDPKGV